MIRTLPLPTLTFDSDLWPRERRDEARVNHLADLLRAGQTLPPIKIQKGTTIVLGGWHTAAACSLIGETTCSVEIVDVPPDERLLYAYREDASAALPYSDADVRSVARRLYAQRCTNGQLPEVVKLATDLGRSRQTVTRWVQDLVTEREASIALKRAAREVTIHAFRATGLSLRRIAALIGASDTQVRRDAHVSITTHLLDSRIVTDAHSLIHLALGQGATTAEMEAARDWLLSQTNPAHLEQRERRRAWSAVASEVREWTEQIQRIALPTRPDDWAGCETERDEIRQALGPLETYVQQLKVRVE